MKKTVAFLLCFAMLLPLTSCYAVPASSDDTADIGESTKYYTIERIFPTTVRYSIYDLNGNVVLCQETDRALTIDMLNENVLDICIGFGVGFTSHQYYDIPNNRFSRVYEGVVEVSDNLVAYIDLNYAKGGPIDYRKLVVRDIFNAKVFFKMFELNLSASVPNPIKSATFTAGEESLEVVYLSETPPVPVSVTLPIRRALNEDEMLPQVERAMQAYEAVLKNERMVLNPVTSEYRYLKDCCDPYNQIPLCELEYLNYVYMDVDGDLINELVIDCGDIMILRYYEGTVYVYEFTFRNMYQFNTDGSYHWNHTGQNFEYGARQLVFEGAALKTKELWRIVNDGMPDAEYYVEGKRVTQKEVQKYVEENPKAKVEFLPLEVSWLNKISRAGAVIRAQEYWAMDTDKYIIVVDYDAYAPSSVYVVTLIEKGRGVVIRIIWIDKTTGEAINPPDCKG